MKSITIQYPVLFGWMKKRVSSTMPEKWAELKPNQLNALVRALNESITEDDLLVELLDLSPYIVKKLDVWQRYWLSRDIHLLSSNAPYGEFIIPVVMNLVPPKKGLSDVSFAEFMYIDTFYMDYLESNTCTDLVNLCSCLYVRPEKLERPTFTGKIDTYKIRNTSPVILESIALNYGLIRTWLQKAYPEVFPEPKKSAEPTNKKKDSGWLGVFDSLVGDDLTNADKYANMPCTEVLRFMNRKVKESKSIKRKTG